MAQIGRDKSGKVFNAMGNQRFDEWGLSISKTKLSGRAQMIASS